MISGPVGGLFNVFLERARSTAPDAAAQLANAIAVRYGIPAAEVERRLAIGRFRVKGNVDRATADSFAADLTRLGAIVTIASAEEDVRAAAPVSLQQPRVAPPPKPAGPSPYTSGLSAAAANVDADDPGLGALSGEFPLTLSTLDGADDDHRSDPGSRAAATLPASFGPPTAAVTPPPAIRRGADADVDVDVALDDDEPRGYAPPAAPGDMFAPPESASEQLALEVDEPAPRARRRSSAPPPVMAAPPAGGNAGLAAASPASPASSVAPRTVHPEALPWKARARQPRVQFVAGVVLCAALGLIPAAIVGAVRERSAFAELNSQLEQQQVKVSSLSDWENLDRVRASFAERKRAERQSIALTSVLLWAAISGGLAYVWFRVIDWDRVLGD